MLNKDWTFTTLIFVCASWILIWLSFFFFYQKGLESRLVRVPALKTWVCSRTQPLAILFHDKRLLTLEIISVDTIDSQAGQLLKTAYKMYSTYWVFFLQVKAFSSTSFLTSSVDAGLSLWKDDGVRLKAVKGDHSVSLDRKLQTDSILCSVTKLLTLEHFLPFKTVYILSQFLSPPRRKKR